MFWMQLSIRLAAIGALIFAAVCLWFAIEGFMSPADVSDPDSMAGGREFAWFWVFLAGVGVLIGVLSWRVSRSQSSPEDKGD
jgi:membrane protein implicated in regulation of membrane protease activity